MKSKGFFTVSALLWFTSMSQFMLDFVPEMTETLAAILTCMQNCFSTFYDIRCLGFEHTFIVGEKMRIIRLGQGCKAYFKTR